MFAKLKVSLPQVGAFLLGCLCTWLLVRSITDPVTALRGTLLRQDISSYPLIAPLLACDVGSEEAFPEFVPLKAQLTSLINQKEKSGVVEDVSVYLRSMRTGRWFEIQGNDTYAPASLLKVFVMMAYYKEADESDNPALLERELLFEESRNTGTDTPGEVIPHLTPGEHYSIKDLIKQMIVYSDNDALNTLVDHFDSQTVSSFEKIFDDLSIPSPITQNEKDLNFISVDKYATVFRVLFGSTYLSDRYSQKALELLTDAQYKEALVAGVPSTLSVAHKFGVTTVATPTTNVNELHDCGIVYYPNHPYLLCVMTKGKNFADLQNTIKEVSTSAYQWLDQYFKSLPTATAQSTTQ